MSDPHEHDPAPPLHRYAIGELYHPRRTQWPEVSQWRLSETGSEMVLFYGSPTSAEIHNVGQGDARFALLAGQHALIVAHRFGDEPWSDTPWQACRQTDMPPGLPPVADGEHLLVTVVLVDASTGIVQAIRATSWSARFANSVRQAIAAQRQNGSTDEQGATEIDTWYRRYPSSSQLARGADLTTRGGGG